MSTKTSLVRYLLYLASRLFFSLQNKSNHGNEITNSLRFLSTEKGERKEINKCFAKTGQFKYHSQCCQTFGLHKIKISFHVESFWPCLLFQFVWGASHLHLEHGLQNGWQKCLHLILAFEFLLQLLFISSSPQFQFCLHGVDKMVTNLLQCYLGRKRRLSSTKLLKMNYKIS